jgi:hypothetical protein
MEKGTVNSIKKQPQRHEQPQHHEQPLRHKQTDRRSRRDYGKLDKRQQSRSRGHTTMTAKSKNQCIFCGGEYPHQGVCPTKGKTCNYCKKENHFRNMCLKLKKRHGKVNAVIPQNDSSDEECV